MNKYTYIEVAAYKFAYIYLVPSTYEPGPTSWAVWIFLGPIFLSDLFTNAIFKYEN